MPKDGLDLPIGKLISLISKSLARYEGTLDYIDKSSSKICLKNVRSFGSEDRMKDESKKIAGSSEVFEFILFRAQDVKDLEVLADALPLVSVIEKEIIPPTMAPLENQKQSNMSNNTTNTGYVPPRYSPQYNFNNAGFAGYAPPTYDPGLVTYPQQPPMGYMNPGYSMPGPYFNPMMNFQPIVPPYDLTAGLDAATDDPQLLAYKQFIHHQNQLYSQFMNNPYVNQYQHQQQLLANPSQQPSLAQVSIEHKKLSENKEQSGVTPTVVSPPVASPIVASPTIHIENITKTRQKQNIENSPPVTTTKMNTPTSKTKLHPQLLPNKSNNTNNPSIELPEYDIVAANESFRKMLIDLQSSPSAGNKTQKQAVKPAYNPSSSFFDNFSQIEAPTATQEVSQRAHNTHTFGQVNPNHGNNRYKTRPNNNTSHNRHPDPATAPSSRNHIRKETRNRTDVIYS